MSQVLVRDLDPAVVAGLKEAARRQGRSLQTEVKALLERAVATDIENAGVLAARIRRRLGGRRHSDSARLVAQDRRR